MRMTREQSDAVARSGQDVCVIAGPGSGKTLVLAERLRHRIEQGVSPLRLLAITFTESAANGLKQQLAQDFSGSLGVRDEIERAQICTVDTFCAGLLRQHAVEAGLDPAFVILDAADAYAELRDAAAQALNGLLENEPERTRALLAALDVTDIVEAVAFAYTTMRATATNAREGAAARFTAGSAAFDDLLAAARQIAAADPGDGSRRAALRDVQEWARRLLSVASAPLSREHFRVLNEFTCNLGRMPKDNAAYDHVRAIKATLLGAARQALAAEYYATQRALLWRVLEQVDEAYRRRKEALNALDAADLAEYAIRLLRDNVSFRSQVRSSFDEVLMDELQDATPLQITLISLVRRRDRFFGAGDTNQSICGFRHAEPESLRTFRRALESSGKRVDRLQRSFRARADILFAIEAVLHGANGFEVQRLEAIPVFRTKAEPSVELIAAAGETFESAARLEAQCVAQRIRDLEGSLEIDDRSTGKPRRARLSDIAVLVRDPGALAAFEEAFCDWGIPHTCAGGPASHETREASTLINLLRVIVNPRDEVSMAIVLRSPLAGVSNDALFRLKETGNLAVIADGLRGVDLATFDSTDAERLGLFAQLLTEARAFADELSPDRLLQRIMAPAGYENCLSAAARAGVTSFLAELRRRYGARPRPLIEVIRDLDRLHLSGPRETEAAHADRQNAVRISTIHAAKGLEFPIVFAAALHWGATNDAPPLAFSPSSGLAARWLDPASHEPVLDLAYTAFAGESRHRQANEDNRLLYVAMTRAQEHLVLSFAHTSSPRNWASRIARALDIDLAAAPAADVSEVTAGLPDSEFRLRVWRAMTAPASPLRNTFPVKAGTVVPPQVAVARPAGQQDSGASVTSIALFSMCPRRYYLARYLGFTTERAPVRPLAHEIEDESLDSGDFDRLVHDLLAGRTLPHPPQHALDLAARFNNSELGRRAASAARVERDFEILIAAGDMIIEGRIDLWFEHRGELTLVNYKTDAVEFDEVEHRTEEYALQMRLYALALERYTGRLPSRACLHFLKPDLIVPVSLKPDELQHALEMVHAFSSAQNSMDFPLREGPGCSRCGFRGRMCPATS